MKNSLVWCAILICCVLASCRETPKAGKFQIVVVKSAASGVVAIKLDSDTGETWIYDTNYTEVPSSETKQRLNYTDEEIKKLQDSGYAAMVPAYWRKIPDRQSEIILEPILKK